MQVNKNFSEKSSSALGNMKSKSSEISKPDVCFIETDSKSSSQSRCLSSGATPHTIQHEYVCEPCLKCGKRHYQQHTIVSGFVLKFLDQMCPYKSKTELSDTPLKYMGLEPLDSESVKNPSIICNYCKIPTRLKSKPSNNHPDTNVRRNGLNPSDTNINVGKSTQCCVACLVSNNFCPVCSGQTLKRKISQSTQNEDTINRGCKHSTAKCPIKDEEINASPCCETREISVEHLKTPKPSCCDNACSVCDMPSVESCNTESKGYRSPSICALSTDVCVPVKLKSSGIQCNLCKSDTGTSDQCCYAFDYSPVFPTNDRSSYACEDTPLEPTCYLCGIKLQGTVAADVNS